MIWFALILVALAVLSLSLWIWNRGPIRNVTQPELGKYLAALLNRGYDGGFLVVRPQRRKEFIQFAKYIHAGHAGLQFDFPNAPWSRSYYDRLQNLLRDQGFAFELQPVSGGEVGEFVTVDLGRSLDTAARLAALCLNDLFEYQREEPVEVLFRGVSPRDERIGV